MADEQYTYTVKTDGSEDGIGEGWSMERALAHISRCEYKQKGIKYEIVEHELAATAELQPTKPKRGRPKSSPESSDE
jgi:hypothetical protein